ncbi:MAG TPA: N-acetylgalactosamine-6-sulfatase [Rhodopirellula baltica]|uniref:N-acetylgalactosamine-4-sulfatase n=1 Tax=Rhodopirellula baltica (strain DSM 10527 / NCIMB 13988 / SH1) TaxID=243090 RepID=Q7URW3_RHOBA|nr:N-acetylgalactosamine-6-sulfatase [Rhodopirellula baltica]CAD74224.1 N-acetylgalactosamine-4-sulfatase precursor [Rhodopirellula baltica SH 1]HBE61209.1 N-acetylgalactosamine-6-sulfatase [Rhodopirellula baltica]
MLASPPRSIAAPSTACLFLASVALCWQGTTAASQPNLVVIIADDLGYGETGMMGNAEIPTPAIDALARSGVRCTSGYVTSSYCSPSRAGFLSGRYQSRFGYDLNPTGERNNHPNAGLPPQQKTFVEHLQSAGYQTSLIGKWHLGTRPSQVPTSKGFDRFFGFLHEGHFYVPGPPFENVWTMLRDNTLPTGRFETNQKTIRGNYARINEPDYDAGNPMLDGSEPIEHWNYLTDSITDKAIDAITQTASKPFAMVVSYNAVHSPMQASLEDHAAMELIDDPQRRIFAGMLIALDRGVGRIIEKLDQQKLRQDTLVVFFSDNGGPTAELTSSNAPLRGGKGSLYEGGVRIPMIWSMPGTIPAGAEEDTPILSLDIAASFLPLAVGEASQLETDGTNVLPWIGRGTFKLPRTVWWRMPRGARALRHGDWKFVQARQNQPIELFNLALDLSESKDLSDVHPNRLQDLLAAWDAVQAEMPPAKTFD